MPLTFNMHNCTCVPK